MSNPIRGDDSRDRIEDIARGNQTLAELAEKYGVNHQTMREWSVRHSDEIATRKAELQAEQHAASAALWVSDRVEILRFYQLMLDKLRPIVTASDVDDRVQSRAVRNAKTLLRDCAEIEGLLQTRSRVELEVSNAELPAPGTKWGPIADGQPADS